MNLVNNIQPQKNVRPICAWMSYEAKKGDWLSQMKKAPTLTENFKKQRDNTKTPPQLSITQRLRTDLGRSVGVTIVTKLVW